MEEGLLIREVRWKVKKWRVAVVYLRERIGVLKKLGNKEERGGELSG